MGEDSWWTIHVPSLVILVSVVLVLSCEKTDRQTDRETRLKALLRCTTVVLFGVLAGLRERTEWQAIHSDWQWPPRTHSRTHLAVALSERARQQRVKYNDCLVKVPDEHAFQFGVRTWRRILTATTTATTSWTWQTTSHTVCTLYECFLHVYAARGRTSKWQHARYYNTYNPQGSMCVEHCQLLPTVGVGRRSSPSVCLIYCLSVCLSVSFVSLFVCPQQLQTTDPKLFKLCTGNDFGIPQKWYCFGVQRSKVDSNTAWVRTLWVSSSCCSCSGLQSWTLYTVVEDSWTRRLVDCRASGVNIVYDCSVKWRVTDSQPTSAETMTAIIDYKTPSLCDRQTDRQTAFACLLVGSVNNKNDHHDAL